MFKVKYLLFALQEKITHKFDAISFTKPNCHHRYPTVLCCLPWLMILGCNVLLCEMTHTLATSSLTNLLLLEIQRSDLQLLNCESTRIYRYRRAGCSTVFQIGYDILTISISFYFPSHNDPCLSRVATLYTISFIFHLCSYCIIWIL
jgi:hypothetical protein